MRRGLKWIAGLLALALVAAAAWDFATFDRQGWLSDYRLLKRGLAQRYANLDWVAEHRKLDLVALDRETEAALVDAHSRVQGYWALRRFVRAFADPHVTLRRARPDPPATSAVAAATPTSGCEAGGYRDDRSGFAERWVKVANWRPAGALDADFPIALVGDTGVLRIGTFDDQRYLAACKRAFRPGMDREALRSTTRGVLNREIAAALAALHKQGARRLLIDVSGNGGGSEWVIDAVALMTPRRLVRAAPLVADPPCDRSGIWEGRPDCPIFSARGGTAVIAGKGAWRGPIAIYADKASASATEDFTAWLRQNKAAILIGERTAGAGCGYVNGGGRIRLPHAGLEARFPNCARFLADGTNEIEGQTPDIPIAETDDASWAHAIAAAMRQARAMQ